jgi:hypothetical protein
VVLLQQHQHRQRQHDQVLQPSTEKLWMLKVVLTQLQLRHCRSCQHLQRLPV